MDLEDLLYNLNQNPLMARFAKLNKELVGLIESYNLVSFQVYQGYQGYQGY